jgi:hypothetical protein
MRTFIKTQMTKILLLLLLTSPSIWLAWGQNDSENYKFRADIQDTIEKDTVAWKYQVGATAYSFIGDYANVLTTWDKGANARIYTPTSLDTLTLKSGRLKNAQDYILDRSKSENLIIINEAHHIAKHRLFTASLLEGLYQNGYRYLGLEALTGALDLEQKYATSESGYYTHEPEMGHLIYEARRLGFVVFGYEATAGKNGKEREIEQAKNIQAFLGKNPKGKVIIHCGFDHVYENEVHGWEKAMAGRLKEYTGIDPFTIDQVKFTERSKPEFSHYFVYATQQTQPFVVVLPNEEVFNGINAPKQTDLVVVHPVSHYKNDSPHWLSHKKGTYVLPKTKLKHYTYPIQVLAYRLGEYDNKGIPAAIVEIQNADQNTTLYLSKNHYEIVIRNRDYSLKERFNISVK